MTKTINNGEARALLPSINAPKGGVPDGAGEHLGIPPHLLGIVLVSMSAFLFSVLSTLVKFASFSMPSMEIVFWRSLTTWIINFAVMRAYKIDLRVDKKYHAVLATRCLVGTCAMSLGFFAMQQMVLADASVLLFTSPIMTFFLGALVLKERIDPVSFCFALLSFVGIVCVSRPTFIFGASSDDSVKNASAFVVMCALLGAVARSIVYVSMRRLQQVHFMVVVHYYLLTTTVISALWLLIVQREFVVNMSAFTWFVVLCTGVCGFFSQMCLTRGFQLEKAGIAAVMRNLDIVFVFIWDFALLHETISAWSIVGAVLVCGGVIMIALRRMQQPKQ